MKKKKILIVAKSLSEGGSERASAVLSLMLKQFNYEVSFVVLYNKISYDFYGNCFVLNSAGEKKSLRTSFSFFIDFKNYVAKNNFDFIIDFRTRNSTLREFLIYNLIYKKAKNIIYTIHLPELFLYIPKPFFLFKTNYSNALRVITVSNEIKKLVRDKYKLKNVELIYNAIDILRIKELKDEEINENENFILIIARMDNDVKQVNKLVDIYDKTNLKENNIKLFIMGDGVLLNNIKANVKRKSMDSDIRFLSFQKNPYKYLSKAKFLVLCSKFEGFPYVILESFACSTPVVSFDCKTGPREIIMNEYNGLLVKDQDFKELVVAIDRFVLDSELYTYCKKNTFKSIENYDIKVIAKKWMNIIETSV